MKTLKMMLTAVILMTFPAVVFAQIPLHEVKISSDSYKYLDAVNFKEAKHPVKLLQEKVATYNIKEAPFYEAREGHDIVATFYISDGSIVARYNHHGKLLRTAEKYKNVKMPDSVTNALITRFPNWGISENVYLVNYYDHHDDEARHIYKIVLENGDERIRVTTDETGKFY